MSVTWLRRRRHRFVRDLDADRPIVRMQYGGLAARVRVCNVHHVAEAELIEQLHAYPSG